MISSLTTTFGSWNSDAARRGAGRMRAALVLDAVAEAYVGGPLQLIRLGFM
jgi:hypothetical protein